MSFFFILLSFNCRNWVSCFFSFRNLFWGIFGLLALMSRSCDTKCLSVCLSIRKASRFRVLDSFCRENVLFIYKKKIKNRKLSFVHVLSKKRRIIISIQFLTSVCFIAHIKTYNAKTKFSSIRNDGIKPSYCKWKWRKNIIKREFVQQTVSIGNNYKEDHPKLNGLLMFNLVCKRKVEEIIIFCSCLSQISSQ